MRVKKFFSPNITGVGRLIRFLIGCAFVFAGWLLGYYGFQANVAQSGNTQTGIRMMVSIYPAIGALVSAAFMLAYPLKESFLQNIEAELAARRAASGKPDQTTV